MTRVKKRDDVVSSATVCNVQAHERGNVTSTRNMMCIYSPNTWRLAAFHGISKVCILGIGLCARPKPTFPWASQGFDIVCAEL